MSQLLKTQRKKFPYNYMIINTSMEPSIQTFLFKISNLKNKKKTQSLNCEKHVSVAENAEKKISIQLYDNKYFYENFNSNFSLQNKQLKQFQLELRGQKICLSC